MTQQPNPPLGGDEAKVDGPEIEYEVWQNGEWTASADRISDALRYMAMYGQDGPVEAKTSFTFRVPGFTDAFRLVEEAAQESGSNRKGDLPTEPVADRWADLERLAKAATPGPWRTDENNVWGACNPDDTTSYGMGINIVECHSSAPQWAREPLDYEKSEENAAFIAAANPSAVLELIAAARAKEAGE